MSAAAVGGAAHAFSAPHPAIAHLVTSPRDHRTGALPGRCSGSTRPRIARDGAAWVRADLHTPQRIVLGSARYPAQHLE
ncbi:hypothetical protein [Cellulomonas sp. NPDC089187]|uniref:hypothetical protein n=1 Tax=Cellulomonas sp. NPDC089187 TaxID=3154970 RepID=UPI0034414EDE